jgi:integration host factor subunit beta
MTKSELIKLLTQQKPNYTSEEITKMVDLIFETISEALSKGQRIEIRGFGSFTLRTRKGRNNARDPRNGRVIAIDDRVVIYFRQGKVFFDKINHLESY